MTEFFNYDELTWPEVADLPRDVPLILPLGTGHNLEQLAAHLSNPPRIGLLPAFPFGWRGSALELPSSSTTSLRSARVAPNSGISMAMVIATS